MKSVYAALRNVDPVEKELILNHHEGNLENCTTTLPTAMLSETGQEEMLINKGFPLLQVLGSATKPPAGL